MGQNTGDPNPRHSEVLICADIKYLNLTESATDLKDFQLCMIGGSHKVILTCVDALRFDAVVAMIMNVIMMLDVQLCSVVKIQGYHGTFCINIQERRNVNSSFPRNVGKYLSQYAM
jgi:hypothetical protein